MTPTHGPDCSCDSCRAPRVAETERFTSTDRLAWLEKKVLSLTAAVEDITKGRHQMGYALWCQPGSHSFDENDKSSKRMTTDELDDKGKKTGNDVTVHICGRHVQGLFDPKPKSLREIEQEIAEATAIDA
jgi:hypothetical protein